MKVFNVILAIFGLMLIYSTFLYVHTRITKRPGTVNEVIPSYFVSVREPAKYPVERGIVPGNPYSDNTVPRAWPQ